MKNNILFLIKELILNERNMLADFRKRTSLNRSEVEVLAFADNCMCFTVYQVQKHFKHTNIQTVRRAIKTLVKLAYIEYVGLGSGPNAAVYMATYEGKSKIHALLSIYAQKIIPNDSEVFTNRLF